MHKPTNAVMCVSNSDLTCLGRFTNKPPNRGEALAQLAAAQLWKGRNVAQANFPRTTGTSRFR